jgi:hypothetical protein
MAEWEWNGASRRYRNKTTGRYLSASSSVDLRDDVVVRLRSEAADLARRLSAEEITVQEWESLMQRAIREVNSVQFAFGRGGRNAMADADRQALAELVNVQQGFLRQFAEDIADGALSEAQIAARSKLYQASSVQAYEQGRASAWGVSLPAHPGDGSTPCKANCRCHWSIQDAGDEIHATWKLGGSEHCSTCKSRASTWAPLVITKADDGRAARLWRAVA